MKHPKLPDHKPHYTLVETSKGKDPAIVVVNSGLRLFEHRKLFPWHLEVTINCLSIGENGMPTKDENDVLYKLEDLISSELYKGNNAVFLARITCRGDRELKYRVHDPRLANSQLETLVEENAYREWQYSIEEDTSWTLARSELSLFEKDHGYT